MSPDESNRLGGLIAQAHRAENEARPLPVVGNAWARASDAYGCARQIAYRMAGVEPTEPVQTASFHSFAMGHSGHDLWQRYAVAFLDETALIEVESTIPDTTPESRCAASAGRCVAHDADLEDGECPKQEQPRPLLGSHTDAIVWTVEGVRQAVEVKTVGEYGYVDAVIKGFGPKHSHVVQASLNAYAVGAEEAVIVYVPMNVISTNRANAKGVADDNRYGAQWTLPKHRWLPIAEMELARLDWIRRTTVEKGPAAVLRWWSDKEQGPEDDPGVIRDPENTTWPCGAKGAGYCPFLSRCLADGP